MKSRRSRRAQQWAAALGAAALSLTLVSCGNDAEAAQEDRPLRLWVRQADDGLATHQLLADAYEKKTGKKIEIFSVTTDFEQRLLRAATSDDLPDLFINDNSSSSQFIDADLVAEIDRSAVPGGDELSDRAWESVRSADGKYFGVPFTASTFLTFIRSDWLEATGNVAPTTHDEMTALATTFTNDDPDGNGKNDTYGMNLPVSTERGYASFIWTTYLWQGGGDFLHEFEDGTFSVAINEPEAVESLTWFRNLQCELKVVQPDAVNTVTVDAHKNFSSGLAGIYLAGVQMIARYDEDPGPDKFVAVAPPAGPADATVLAESANSYIIKDTPKFDEALEYAAFAASPEGQQIAMNPDGFAVVLLPVNTSVNPAEVHADERWTEAARVYEENGKYYPAVPNWTPFRQISADAVNKAIADCSSDPQELLDEAAVKFEAELTEQGVLHGKGD